MRRIDLASDNFAGASPEIIDALAEAARGTAAPYGADPATASVERRLGEIFETELAVVPVVSGTAANALALAACCPPYGAVATTDCAHVLTSECGAPEFYAGGAKLAPVTTVSGRMDPGALVAAIAARAGHGVHESQVHAVTLTQATEWGTAYTPDAIAALAAVAREAGAKLHMDGARFANALVHLGCTPAAMTWRAGVDILSFGATKNGALAAEAIVVFDRTLVRGLAERRKQGGHLLSKHRFLSAQLAAYLADDLWLRNARRANAAAARIAAALVARPGVELVAPVEANEIFARVPPALADTLEAGGIGFYRWAPDGERLVIRLVTSFATTDADLDAVEAALAGCGANPRASGSDGVT